MTKTMKTTRRKPLASKVLACLFALCLATAMVPGVTPGAAIAQTESGNTVKMSVEMGTAAFERHGLVYYGSYQGDPIVWETLSNVSSGAWEGIGPTSTYPNNTDINRSRDVALMMSKYTLANRAYNYTKQTPSVWATSDLHTWLNGDFLTSSFTANEQNYMLATSKGIAKDESSGGREMNADKVFVPDHNETKRYVYGLTGWVDDEWETTGVYAEDVGARKPATNKEGKPEQWWTRCNNSFKGPDWPYGYGDGSAMQVCQADPQSRHNPVSDRVDAEQDDARIGVRPFFNLDMRKVLFTTPANFDDRVGALTRNTVREDNKTDETAVKMTMLDSSRNGFSATTNAVVTQRGAKTTIAYTGAKTGSNEYISAMIVDGSDSNKVVYYGQLGAVSAANGTVDFTMPADIRYGSYKLVVFNEQVNGPKATNLAGQLPNGISFTMGKMEAQTSDFTFTPPENLAYDGKSKFAAIAPSDTNFDKIDNVFQDGFIDVTYYDQRGQVVQNPTNVGTYTVRVTVRNIAGTNYNAKANITDKSWKFTIERAESQATPSADTSYVQYGAMVELTARVGMAQQRRAPARFAPQAPAADTVEFYVGEGNDAVSIGTARVAYDDITKKDAGTATLQINTRDKLLKPGANIITARYGGSVTLNDGDGPSTRVMVEPQAVSITWSGAQERIFDGNKSKVAATASGMFSGDEVNVVVEGGDQVNAGTHTARATGLSGAQGGYYKLSGTTTKDYTIKPKTVAAEVRPIEAQTYTGSKIEPEVAAFDGQTEIPASEYTVQYSSNQNVGQASVILKDNEGGNYNVGGLASFDIKPKSIQGAQVGEFDEMNYYGIAQTPAAKVTVDGLEATGTWSDVTNVSDTSTFTASGNFTGTLERSPGMKPKSIEGAHVYPFAEMTYTGKPQTPSATVSIDGVVGGTDVPGAWSPVTNVSDVTTFTATGNFTGTIAGRLTGMKPKTVTATLQPIKAQAYTGGKIEPKVMAFDGATEIPASEYMIQYSNNENVGRGSVTLQDNEGGNYVVSGTTTFDIAQATPRENPVKKTTAKSFKGRPLVQAAVVQGEMLGVDGQALQGTFAWENGLKLVQGAGAQRMVFTPVDAAHYAPATFDVQVSLYSPQDVNLDADGDGKADLNIDTNNDGVADLNIDTDGDGKPDANIDADGNGIIDDEEKPEPTKPDDNNNTNSNANNNAGNNNNNSSKTTTTTTISTTTSGKAGANDSDAANADNAAKANANNGKDTSASAPTGDTPWPWAVAALALISAAVATRTWYVKARAPYAGKHSAPSTPKRRR